jgi:CRISPR-associated endonuclease/helicase Cas3
LIAFTEFMRVLHGEDFDPYSWQERLARQCAEGEPPAVIAVPTGAGKTTTIDALVWALASQAERPAAERTVGVRIVWAIDRRILVDEVHKHASELADLLRLACDDDGHPLAEVARRLAQLSGGAPLLATRWRGGLGAAPERYGPLQPQIITSTVAQIGSRLLFRGYGVGTRSLALEAGLAACDTTICLDEAHLAEPFRQTVSAIRHHRGDGERALALPGLRVIQLTATPPRQAEDVIELDDEDRAALGPRISGVKRARLVEPEAGADDGTRVALLADAAAGYVRSGKATVACVANTVYRARAVFDALRKQLDDEVDIALLIGPQRPADRAQMLTKHHDALFNGTPGARPLVCVATQTFEVGLDADVEAMVTESASATALIQRLGRLNRRGLCKGSATIVRDAGRWLYADDEPAAWRWLQGLLRADDTIDMSVGALEHNAPPQPAKISRAATLTPDVIELLVQTSPRPGPWQDPAPDAFIRGVQAKPAIDVAVCWRADLRPELADQAGDEYRAMLLELVPPGPEELLTLSLTSARALLAARYPDGERPSAAARKALLDADVEDAMLDAPVAEPRADDRQVQYLVIRGGTVHRGIFGPTPVGGAQGRDADEGAPISFTALRAGDVIVLPTEAGGADEHGLALLQPHSEAAIDVAADLRPDPGGTAAPVRITPGALAASTATPWSAERRAKIAKRCADAEAKLAEMGKVQARRSELDRLVRALCEELPDHQGLRMLMSAEDAGEHGHGLMLRSLSAVDLQQLALAADEDGTDDQVGRVWVILPTATDRADRGKRTAGEVNPPPSIDAHALAVSMEVKAFAESLGLSSEISAALVLAARAHDHGKADPRIQAFYRRGLKTFGASLLAKSEFGMADPRASRLAARLAALPKHQHHEIASVAILAVCLASETSTHAWLDVELALYLVAVHHGLGRPIPAVPEGGDPARPFEVDAAGIRGTARGDGRDGWADGAWLERFWRVQERYGAWGLAYLEALLMSADRLVSARGA